MQLRVNGRARDVAPPPHESLLTTLRDRLALTGAKLACDRGECGACTVLVDGEPAYACLALTAACEGVEVTTIEGIGGPDGLHPVQEAFITNDAVQCGYCTPGQVLSAIALLSRNGAPDESAIHQALSGNLCRCGTYPGIVKAIHDAAALLRGELAAPATGEPR
jgi:xanthine dehydrogenase YagT iron-sulfur-binding subunit